MSNESERQRDQAITRVEDDLRLLSEASRQRRFERWLVRLRTEQASDLYLVAGVSPSIRLDGARDHERRVTRCAHGFVRVTFDRVTLTLSEHEFYGLQTLLRLASERWQGEGPTAGAGGRPH